MRRWWPWTILGALLLWAGWSWVSGGIVHALLRSDSDAATRVAALRQWFADCGMWAPAAYVLFVTAEVVVAPVPGILLYAPGGMIFGTIAGGTLALIGNTLGAGVACLLARSLSQPLTDRLLPARIAEPLQREFAVRGAWWIFVLRVNPLTSSDLVSWAAGTTRTPVTQVMLATACGMAPLCYLQAWLSESLFTRFPWLIYPLLATTVVVVAILLIVVRRMLAVDPCQPSDCGSIVQQEA